jgi:VanZ family protein
MPRLPRPPRWLRIGGLLAVVGVIVYFSLLDTPGPPPVGPATPWYDKQLHFASYAAVTVAAAGATIELRARRWYRIAVVVAFAVAFGVGIELAQWPLADRYASLGDVAANAAGTAVGSLWFPVEARFGYASERADATDAADVADATGAADVADAIGAARRTDGEDADADSGG